jgi:proteasome lid subunit RPN8/RPN11
MSDVRFASWAVAESPVTVEYSLVAIEEIRREVAQGFQKLARGGVEVGGILYGSREGRTVRVLAIRSIECEHARGPSFLLSDNDREALERQIRHEGEDPRLDGMICVGWFLSHTRSEIMLSDFDLEVYSTYFGAPWQVALVVRPGRSGGMRAGFFVREHDGTVRSENSYLEFSFPDRLAGVLDRPPRPERGPVDRLPPAYAVGEGGTATVPVRREITRAMHPPVLATLDLPQQPPAARPRAKWPWLVGWVLAVAAIVLVLLQYVGVLSPHTATISLSVAERDGQLQIEWNHNAKPVTAAAGGSLAIVDGSDVRKVALSRDDLARGSFLYQRNSGDVEVRILVTTSAGEKLGEGESRFLGRPPVKVDANQLQDLQRQRDELQAEVDQLKQENGEQAARVQELERTLRIMQARLGAK